MTKYQLYAILGVDWEMGPNIAIEGEKMTTKVIKKIHVGMLVRVEFLSQSRNREILALRMCKNRKSDTIGVITQFVSGSNNRAVYVKHEADKVVGVYHEEELTSVY